MSGKKVIISLLGLAVFAGPLVSIGAGDEPSLPEIAGLTLHLDAGDSSAISLQDGRVVEWRASNDPSIVFVPAEQFGVDGDWAPAYISGEENTERPVNNRPVVRFESSSLTSDSAAARAMTNDIAGVTFFGVGWNTGGGAQNFLRIRGASTVVRLMFYRATNDHRFGGRRLDSDAFESIISPSGTRLFEQWGIDSVIADYTNDNVFMHINGVEIQSATSWLSEGRTSPTDSMEMSVGSDNRTPRDQLWQGDIAEILFFNRVLSPAEFNQVGSYLAEKHGLDWPEPDVERISLELDSPVRKLEFDTVEGREYLIFNTLGNGDWQRIMETPMAGTGERMSLSLPGTADASTFRVIEWVSEQAQESGTPELPEIEGLRLHLDASAADTLSLEGSNVNAWRSANGEDMEFVQADSARRPVRINNWINGRPALIFDGGRFLESESSAALALTNDIPALTFFGVGWNSGSGAQNYLRISKGGEASPTAARAMFYRATNDHRAIGGRLDEGGTETLIGGPRLVEEWGIDSSVLDFENTEGFLYIGGAEVDRNLSFTAGAAEGGNTSPTDAHRFRIAANTADDPGQLWDGDIAEILLFERALSLEERNQVGAYLATKYGLPYAVTTETEIDFEVVDGLELQFSTQLANRYQVERKFDLSEPWEPFGEEIEGIGIDERIFVPFDGQSRAFFRVIRID